MPFVADKKSSFIVDEESSFIPDAVETKETSFVPDLKTTSFVLDKLPDPFLEEQKRIASAVDANRTKDFFLGRPRAFTEAEPPRLEAIKIQKVKDAAITETKIEIVKRQLEKDFSEEGLYGLKGTATLLNVFGVRSFLSEKGLDPIEKLMGTEQGFFLVNEAAKRIVSEKPFSVKKAAMTLPFDVSAAMLEFSALPDVASKMKWLDKAKPAVKRIISTGVLFGERAALRAPEYQETVGDRLVSIGTDTTLGFLLGTTGLGADTTVGALEKKFGFSRSMIRRFALRAPITAGTLGTITALRGGSSSDVLETIAGALAFETLGLVKYAGTLALANKAIKQARKLQPELNNLSNQDVKALLTAQATAVEELLKVSLKDAIVSRRLDKMAKQNIKLIEARAKQQFLKRKELLPKKTKTIKILDAQGKPVEKKVAVRTKPQTFKTLFRAITGRTSDSIFVSKDVMVAAGFGDNIEEFKNVTFNNPLNAKSRKDASIKLFGKDISPKGKGEVGKFGRTEKAIIDFDSTLAKAARAKGHDAIIFPNEIQIVDKTVVGKQRTLAQNVKAKQTKQFNKYVYARNSGVLLENNQIDSIRKIAGDDLIYANVINHVKSYYKTFPEDAQSRQYIFELSKEMALKQKQFGKKVVKADTKGREQSTLSATARLVNAIGDVEAKTGVPLLQNAETIVKSSNRQAYNVRTIVQKALKDKNLSKLRVAVLESDYAENIKRTEWLFEENAQKRQKLFDKLSPDSKVLATVMDDLLQGPIAAEVRKGRFMLWDAADKVVNDKITKIMNSKIPDENKRKGLNKQVKKLKAVQKEYVPDAKLEDLTAFRYARDSGNLEGWLQTQTTGTRKHYFMSGKEAKQMDEFLEMGVPEELAKILKKPESLAKQDLPAFHKRGKRAKVAKRGSALAAVIEHYERVAIQNATAADLKTFVNNVARTEHTNRDLVLYRRFINNSLHRYPHVELPTQLAQGVNRAFWTIRYLDPANVLKFDIRQVGQNFAYGPSQVNILDIAKAQVKFSKQLATGKVDEGLKRAYQEMWVDTVNQSRAMWNEAMLQVNNSIGNQYTNNSRARAIMKWGSTLAAQTVPLSDTANRMVLFTPLYISARDNAQLFNDGKISKNKLLSRLKVRPLHPTQQLILDSKINNPHEYAKEYTKIKIANVHGTYDTKLRALFAQTPLGRMAGGLVVFPRIGAEIMTRNGVRPIVDGLKTHNYKKVWSGVDTLLRFATSSAVTSRAMLLAFGFHAYHPVGTVSTYSPGSPGLSTILDVANDMSFTSWAGRDAGKSEVEIAADMVKVAAGRLEMFIPLSASFANTYEANNNVRGVRLWKRIEKELQDDYLVKNGVRFKKETRTSWEKFAHIAWGGFEKSRQEKIQTFGTK